MPARLQPAFWGGLFIGVLSALPFISILNACCCLWVVTGGILAAYLAQERTIGPLTAGDGAIHGLGAGAIGAVISSAIGMVFWSAAGLGGPELFEGFAGRGDVPPEFSEAFERMANMPAWAWMAISLAVTLVIYPIFSMLGGLLGVAIFKKKLPPPPPDTIDVTPVQ
jgi:hypothetical protein